MGYEYDSQVNRELAKTAMDIYKKAHKIDQPINESPQNLNEEVIRENVNGLIMNYISDVIILAEAQMGREMTDIEINEASDELLRRIDSISDADKVAFINELSEAATMTSGGTTAHIGAQAGKGNVMGGAGSGGSIAPGRLPRNNNQLTTATPSGSIAPNRPAGGNQLGQNPNAGGGPGVVAGRPPADVGGPSVGADDTATAIQNPAVARLFGSAAYQQAIADGDFSAAGQMLANLLAGQQQSGPAFGTG